MGKILVNTGAIFLIIFILILFVLPALGWTYHSVLSSQDYETMKAAYKYECELEAKQNILWSLAIFLAGSGVTLILLGYILKRKPQQIPCANGETSSD